ncbi:MAG: phage holin family protein [Desulfuromonadales bacterium]
MNGKGVKQTPDTQHESLPELVSRLANSSAAVVHDKIDLVIQQFRETGRAVRGGILLIATGAVFGIIGLGSLCAAAIIQLAVYMSPAIAALVTGLAVVFVGFVIAFIGYGKIKQSIGNP